MKKQLLISVVILLATAVLSYAQTPQITGKADLTATSRYVWRGFDIYGSHSAIHPSVDLAAPEYGLGFNVTGHIANGGENVDGQRWDYSPYYFGKLFAKDQGEIDYRFAYVYYNYPKLSSHKSIEAHDLQELNMALSLPNVTTVKGLVPTYVLVKLWPNGSDTPVSQASGFAHIFMLDYAMPFVCPITGVDRKLNLHSEVIYNDGVGPNGANVDHDWSDAVFGASTDIEVAQNFYVTPGVYHQITMDGSLNDSKKNYSWVSLGASYKF
jgi:hypothetical protein